MMNEDPRVIVGEAKIFAMTTRFYDKAVCDTHISKFIRSSEDPHALRMGKWIIQKMDGTKTYWSDDLKTR